MKNLKNFSKFIKENNEDRLNHIINNDNDDDLKINFENTPSELWDQDTLDMFFKYENKKNTEEHVDRLDHHNGFDLDDFDDDELEINNINHELSEKYSELEDYDLKDIFQEKENEND